MDQLVRDSFLVDEEDGRTHLYRIIRDANRKPLYCDYMGKVDSRPGWEATGVPPGPPRDVDSKVLAAWMQDGKKRAFEMANAKGQKSEA